MTENTKSPFADLEESGNPFADLEPTLDQASAQLSEKDNPFLDLEPGRKDGLIVGTLKSAAQGINTVVGGIGGMMEKAGHENIVGPAPVTPQDRLNTIAIHERERALGEQIRTNDPAYTGALPAFNPTEEQIKTATSEAQAETEARQKDWQAKVAQEGPETTRKRKEFGAQLINIGRALSEAGDSGQEYWQPIDNTARAELLKVWTDPNFTLSDATRATWYGIVRNAPNFVVSYGAGLMGRALGGMRGAGAGAFASSYVMEGGDIWGEGAQYLAEKHKGYENVPDQDWAKLVELTQQYAAFNAALDAITPTELLAVGGRTAAKSLGIRSILSGRGIGHIMKTGAKGAATEIPTEVVQEENTMTAVEGLGKNFTPQQRLSRYFEAAITAAGMGHGAGMVEGAHEILDDNKRNAPQVQPDQNQTPANVEDILGGEARQDGFQEPRALPPPEKAHRPVMQVTPEGEASYPGQVDDIGEAEAKKRRAFLKFEGEPAKDIGPLTPEKSGLSEVAGAVQGRAPLPELPPELGPQPKAPDDLLITIARAGGLNRAEAKAQGIDPAHFSDRSGVFGKVLFPRNGGMTMDGLAEFLSQRGYLPEGQYSANDALELVSRMLAGEKIYSKQNAAQAAARQDWERQHELSQQKPDRYQPSETSEQFAKNAEDLRRAIEAAKRDEIRRVFGDEAAKTFTWTPTKDDLALSGYIKESPEVKSLADIVHDGYTAMGDAWEGFYERFLIQHPDLEGAEFERTLREAIRSYHNAQKPGISGEARQGQQDRQENVPTGQGQKRPEGGDAETRPAEPSTDRTQPAKEVTPPQTPTETQPAAPAPAAAPESTPKTEPAKHGFGDDNKVFTREGADRAREILRRKLSGSQLNAGLDPEMMQAGIQLAGYYIEGGARSFKAYSEKMVADLGEAIRPYLKAFYSAVRNWPGFDNAGMQTDAEIDAILEGKKPAADLAGPVDETKQAIHDKKVERQKKIDEAPPMEAGPGDLFSDSNKQQDLLAPMVEAAKAMTEAANALKESVKAKEEKPAERPATTDVVRQAIEKVGEKQFRQYVDDHLSTMDREDMEPAEIAAETEGVARRIMDGAYDTKADIHKNDVWRGNRYNEIGDIQNVIMNLDNELYSYYTPAEVAKIHRDAPKSFEAQPEYLRGKLKEAIEAKKLRETSAPPPREDATPAMSVDSATGKVTVNMGDAKRTDEAAHEAATSPQNDLPEPTEAQKKAGNYKKGRVRIGGLEISIENPAGSKRRPEWPTLNSHYGYIRGYVGRDKDHIDVFIRPGTPSDTEGDYTGPVFVIDQLNDKGEFDEHKVMLGWPTEHKARNAYLKNYEPGWDGIGAITEFNSVDDFHDWLNQADLKQPADDALSEKTPAATVKTVRIADVVKDQPYLTPAEADLKLDEWRRVAESQDKSENSDKTILSLFDRTGIWSQPYVDAGYNVIQVDIENGVDVNDFGIEYFADQGIDEVYGILAACPCTDFAASGARWWAAKDEDGRTVASVELVKQVQRTVNYFKPKFWVIENPVGRIQKLTGLDKPLLTFDPHHFGEPYTKKTMLYGQFNTDLPTANVEPTEGSRIHKLRGDVPEQKAARSETPEGFAYAFFMANGDVQEGTKELDSGLRVEFMGKSYPVKSYGDAAQKWNEFRDRTNIGSSELESMPVIKDGSGKVVAKIAYNGKITEVSQNEIPPGKVVADMGWAKKPELPAPTSTQPQSTAKETLLKSNLSVRKTKTNNGNDVWEVTGSGTRQHKDMLKSLGGRWYGPKKAWSFYKGDPTESISKRLGWTGESKVVTSEPAPEPAMSGKTITINLREGTVSEQEYKTDEVTKPSRSGHFAAGESAFKNGEPRLLPSYFTDKGGKNAKDWYRGWDAANLAEPIETTEKEKPRFTYAIKPADGGFTLKSDDGGGFVATRETGARPMFAGGAQARIFKTEKEAELYAKNKGMALADSFPETKVETADTQADTVTEEPTNEPTQRTARPETGNREGDRAARTDRTEDSGQMGFGLEEGNAGNGEERNTPAAPERSERVRGEDNLGRESGRGNESSGGSRDRGSVRSESRTVARAHDFTITDADEIGAGSVKTKYQNNIAAIRLLKSLEEEGRRASADEQATLAKYVGWGGIKGAFDPNNKQWAKEYAELKELLTDEEYEAARRSILDAHYTSVPIIKNIWAALDRMGFKGGRVLEPSVGVGNFFGLMPADVRAKSSMYGVELDKITAGIARQLYQTADIAGPVGFQDVNIPADSYDVAVGNPPFGSQSIYDKNHPELKKFSLHNFFFAKSLDKVRPGGLMTMVVSRYFMDAADPSARQHIADRAKLVAAFRLPYTAFKGNANTEVVTDIIVLQKLDDGITPYNEWVKTTEIDVDGNKKRINQYFADNPNDVIGRFATTGSMYSKDELTVEPVGDFEKSLAERVKLLPENIYSPETHAQPTTAAEVAEGVAPKTTKIGAYFITPDGKLSMREPDSHKTDANGELLTTHRVIDDMPKATEDRVRGLVKVREALRDLIRAELSQKDDTGLNDKRLKLNNIYDAFVKKFGYINALGNRRAFQDDPDLPLLESLEPEYDPGVSAATAKTKGTPARPAKADKAAIFTKRVLAPYTKVESVDNAKDALTAALNEKGGVDLDYMSQLSGIDQDGIIKELSGLIYQDPESGLWEIADTYLSGNVKAKLAEAKAAAEKDPAKYSANVDALEKVQPADLTASDISATIGAGWIPSDVIADFGRELLGSNPTVHYIKAVGKWSFKAKGESTAHIATWGTARVPADEIIDHLLNARAIVVKDNVGTSREPKYEVNDKETQAARAKADDVNQKFKDWIWKDPARRERLEKIYNDTMNTDRIVQRDGSHLTLPGSNPTIKLRKHQLAAIWRGIQDRTVLLDHVVGAGKTFEMTALAMELRRLGLARKPMLAVPNHLVRQWRDEFYRLYPNANILATTEKDFQKANRQKLFSRITTGDWDAVIVAHSSFKKIGMPSATEKEILGEMLKDIADAIEDMKSERGDRHIMRDMERIKENLEAKMDRLKESGGGKDNVVTFDELGVDAFMLDEAHLYKNLFYHSQMQGVTGLGNPSGSGRAFDMFVKVRYLQKHYGGRAAVVFATGTPVSNSLVEMFTMQRYMMYDDLRDRGIHLLDPWAKMFGEVQNVYEVHPSGNGYRLATRFAKFQNLGELMKTYRGFADVITMDDLKAQAAAAGNRFPVPKLKGGKPQSVVAERSEEQTNFFGVPVFGHDENGNIQFKHDNLSVVANKDGKYEVRRDKSQVAGPFDSETEAQEEANRLMREPVVEYNEGSILWKFENLKKLTKDSDGKVNALSITNEARKAGLDFRLIDPNAPDFAGSKINLAVKNILDVYKEWSADKGTQLVFCDLSVPSSARDKILKEAAKQAEKAAAESLENETDDTDSKDTEEAPAEEEEAKISMDQLLATRSKHSVYDDVKAKLIKAGIPEGEVAFIHDYDTADKKQKLFQAVRDGRVRVLIGSTEKMGAGMNVQDRLVAIHHLDAPWRPSDLEQRNGRIIRQGNKLYERDPDGFEVQEFRYASKQTYDTRMWQIIEHKARGIEQLRKADESTRTMDDIAGEAASAADMKAAASGNPLILDEIKLRTEIRNLEAQEANYNRSLFDLQRKVAILGKADVRHKERMDRFKEWTALRDKNPADADFSVKIGDKTYSERKDISKPMVTKIGEAAKDQSGNINKAGVYRGVHFGFRASVTNNDVHALVSPDGENWGTLTIYGPKDEFSPSGLLTRIDNMLKGLDTEIENSSRLRDREKAELEKAKEEAGKPFAKKEQLDDARRKHREVVSKLQKSGGAISLSPEMRQELNDALKKRGLQPIEEPKFSRVAKGNESAVDYSVDETKREVANKVQTRLNIGGFLRGEKKWRVTPVKLHDAGAKGDRGRGLLKGRSPHKAAEAIARLFGKEVVWVKTEGPHKFNGLVFPGTNLSKYIFIDPDAQFPVHVVLGHEISHHIEGDSPAIWDDLMDAIQPLIKDHAKYRDKYVLPDRMKNSDIDREIIGDLMGDAFDDLSFWDDIGRQNPSLLRRLADLVIEWLDRLIGRVRGQEHMNSSEFVTDIKAARDAITKAVAKYATAKRYLAKDDLGEGGAKFSRRTIDATEEGAKKEREAMPAGILKSYKERAKQIVSRIDMALDPLGSLEDSHKYLTDRLLTLGIIAKGDEIAEQIGKTFGDASPEDSKAIFDYLTTRDASTKGIKNELLREKAARVKRMIESVGDAMVARGALSEEAREANRGSYLPQLYLKWLLNESDWKALGTGKRPGPMGYLKQRKIQRITGPNGEHQFVWKKTGEPLSDEQVLDLGPITDPGFLAATAIATPIRDMALLDFMAKISTNPKWVLPNSLVEFEGTHSTPHWLKAEAERLRKQADHNTPDNAKKLRDRADRMETAANKALEEFGVNVKDLDKFKQMPNTAKYGRLRGLWVRKEIYDDMVGVYDLNPKDPGFIQSLLGYGGIGTKVTQIWKIGKVSLNPPAQVRNFVSNMVLLQLSGVPLHKIPVYFKRAVYDMIEKGPTSRLVKKYGLTVSTFANQELYHIRRDLLDLEKREGRLSKFGEIQRLGAIVADRASHFYQLSETIGKTMKMMHAMDSGMSEAEAAIEAQKWLFDYSLVPQNVRYLRNLPYGMPFITFQYKVLPRLAEVALLHPWRLLPWIALAASWPMLWALMAGEDEEKYKKLKKAMPEWLQKRGHAMILPFQDEKGRWQVTDLGYFFPWTMYTDVAGDLSRGDIGEAVQSAGLFGGPLTNVIVAAKTGKDPFTGRDIVNPGDPLKRQVIAGINYAYDTMMPPIISSRGLVSPIGALDAEYGGKAVQAATGRTNKYGDPSSSLGQAAAYPFGLNLYPIEPTHSQAQNVLRYKYEADQTEMALKRKLENRGLSDETRREIIQEYTDELKRRYQKIEEYKKP